MSKVSKFIWFISLLAGLGALLWVYASLPLTVKVAEEAIIGKEAFFYAALIFLTVFNFSLHLLAKNKLVASFDTLRTWKYSFAVVVNAFYIASLFFINILNSTEYHSYDNQGYVVLIFLSLIVGWILILPFIFYFKKVQLLQ